MRRHSAIGALGAARDHLLSVELRGRLADLTDADRVRLDRLLVEVQQRAGSIRLALDEGRPLTAATRIP